MLDTGAMIIRKTKQNKTRRPTVNCNPINLGKSMCLPGDTVAAVLPHVSQRCEAAQLVSAREHSGKWRTDPTMFGASAVLSMWEAWVTLYIHDLRHKRRWSRKTA